MTLPTWLPDVLRGQPYPLVFATVSGAHRYGFASVDSDVDLRGVHVLPAAEVLGLRVGPETREAGGVRDGVELDLVTHDLLKFCRLLLKPNGYVLEQLLSPLVVTTSDEHAELIALAPECITRHHSHHYLGFAQTQWRLFAQNGELKPALYTLRALLTGAHLMRTGEVVADLSVLHEGRELPYVPELIEAKRAAEHAPFATLVAPERLAKDVERLRVDLVSAATSSGLPDRATAHDALHDLVLRARLGRMSDPRHTVGPCD